MAEYDFLKYIPELIRAVDGICKRHSALVGYSCSCDLCSAYRKCLDAAKGD